MVYGRASVGRSVSQAGVSGWAGERAALWKSRLELLVGGLTEALDTAVLSLGSPVRSRLCSSCAMLSLSWTVPRHPDCCPLGIVLLCKQDLRVLHLCITSQITIHNSELCSALPSARTLHRFVRNYSLWLHTFLFNLITYL